MSGYECCNSRCLENDCANCRYVKGLERDVRAAYANGHLDGVASGWRYDDENIDKCKAQADARADSYCRARFQDTSAAAVPHPETTINEGERAMATEAASGTWLDALKAGDRVVVECRGHETALQALRVTPTTVVVGTMKFRRRDGSEIGGDDWHSKRLLEATPERLARIKDEWARANLIAQIRNAVEGLTQTKLPTETLQAIRVALEPRWAEKFPASP